MRVCAVVVTHNRCELLGEVLDALDGQTLRADALLVVDNASTDATPELLQRRCRPDEVLRLARNEGGAGGFHEGLRAAHAAGHDLLWIMDDDVIASPDALERLLDGRASAAAHDPLLMASKVVWLDGGVHPMNAPIPAWKQGAELLDAAERRTGLLPVRAATFTSLLVDRRAVDRYGLPEKRYFLWSDDLEWTARVLRFERGFLAAGSVVLHKTATPHTALTQTGDRFYYHVRNTLYMLGGAAWAPGEKVGHARRLARSIATYLRQERCRPHALALVARGLRDGVLGGRPEGPYGASGAPAKSSVAADVG